MAYRRQTSELSQLVSLAAGVVAIAALYFAQAVLIPFALAVLFSFLLSPLVVALEKARVPRAVSVSVVVIVCMAAIGSIGVAVTNQLVDVTNQLPSYRVNIRAKVASVRGAQRTGLVKATEAVNELSKEVAEPPSPATPTRQQRASKSTEPKESKPLEVEVIKPSENPAELLQGWLGPIGSAGIVLIFTIFMLLRREDLRNRFIRLVGHSHLNVMTQALDDASHRISKYLLLQFLVNVAYGTVVGVGLYFIGLPNALLWGVMAGLLRFLPYVGSMIGGLLPAILSLAVFDGWARSLMVIGLFLVIEIIVANFVEPMLYGSHTGISSLAILVAAVFWTLLWGIVGLVLSTPLTVCLVVLGRYVPQLGFLHILLGDEPVLAPETHFYQRLLATDHDEARQVLQGYLAGKSLQDLYDSVVIPALVLAERDRHQNDLDERAQQFICQSTRELIEEMNEYAADARNLGIGEAGDVSNAPMDGYRSKIVCLPVRDEADEIIATMLTHLLGREGHRVDCISLGTPVEMVEQAVAQDPDVIFLSALPPFTLNHTRKLYQKLRARMPSVPIVVGVWSFSEEGKLAARLSLDVNAKSVTSLRAALFEIAVCPDATNLAEKNVRDAKEEFELRPEPNEALTT